MPWPLAILSESGACWTLAGALCGGQVQGTYATKLANCLRCEFYRSVVAEGGSAHENAKGILVRLA
jgi:hypothetical protein